MKTKDQQISQDELKNLLKYDPTTGIFTWIKCANKNIRVGDVAGTDDKKGYRLIYVKGVLYKAHRLAWLYMYGVFPNNVIDHINQNKGDNRIENLRDCTHSENLQNSKIDKRNKHGHKGINFFYGKWRATIAINKKSKHLGLFEKIEDAINARKKAENDLHKYASVI